MNPKNLLRLLRRYLGLSFDQDQTQNMTEPFASVVRQCEHSESQEERLRSCRFCGDSQEHQAFFSGEESSPSENLPVASNRILICSLPDGSSQEETKREEERLVTMGSGEANREPYEQVRSRIDGTDSASVVGTVDLGRDSDLLFSDGRSVPEEGCVSQRGVDDRDVDVSGGLVGEDCEADEAYKSKSKDNEFSHGNLPLMEDLGFSGPKEGGSGGVYEDIKNVIDVSMEVENVDKPEESSMEENQGPVKSMNDCPSDFQVIPPVVSVPECLESEPADNSEAPESIKKTSNAYSELKAVENEVQLEMNTENYSESNNPPLHNDGDENPRSIRSAELENVKYSNSGDLASGVPAKDPSELRRLPDWVDGGSSHGQKRRTEGEVKEDGLRGNGGMFATEALVTENPPQPSSNLLDMLNRSSREINENQGDNGDADILDLAKRAGMNFPRPRWWRHGGY